MKLVIAGSRYIEPEKALPIIDNIFTQCGLTNTAEIVSGGSRGVDSAAPLFDEQKGLKFSLFPADWEGLGRKAGPIRNGQMADYGDILLAVWDGESRGTLNMMEQMKARSKPVYVAILSKDKNEVFITRY